MFDVISPINVSGKLTCFTIWGFYLLYLHLFVLFHIKYVHVTVFPFRGLLNNSGHTEMDAAKCLQVGFRISEWAAWNCWLGYRSNSGSTVRVTVICSTLLDHISWHQRTWKEEPHMLGNRDLADWCLLYSNGVSMGCWRKKNSMVENVWLREKQTISMVVTSILKPKSRKCILEFMERRMTNVAIIKRSNKTKETKFP